MWGYGTARGTGVPHGKNADLATSRLLPVNANCSSPLAPLEPKMDLQDFSTRFRPTSSETDHMAWECFASQPMSENTPLLSEEGLDDRCNSLNTG